MSERTTSMKNGQSMQRSTHRPGWFVVPHHGLLLAALVAKFGTRWTFDRQHITGVVLSTSFTWKSVIWGFVSDYALLSQPALTCSCYPLLAPACSSFSCSSATDGGLKPDFPFANPIAVADPAFLISQESHKSPEFLCHDYPIVSLATLQPTNKPDCHN